MKTVKRYGRIQINAPSDTQWLSVTTPSGTQERVPTFDQQAYDFHYDRHGYEDQTPTGPVDRCARYTPDQEGPYLVSDEKGNVVDEFICTPSEHPGYVMVSGKDSRYFACSDGSSYVPIGLNLVGCGYDRQPAGHEHFRTFTDTGHFAYKRVVDADNGRQLTDVEAWFNEDKWNRRWLEDIAPYLARYHNDPVVFSWELWNEIDCGDACFDSVERFTRRMLPEVKQRSPKNLVVNSLGSMDEEHKQQVQDAFAAIPDMDFLQVHRYLDQGAPLAICHADPVAFSLDAVRRCSTGTKPLILTETGAVNDRHVGPFRFYPADHGGLIFDDVTYPPFFCGAAGSGHIWHWDSYVDTQNLWAHFKPLRDALEGVQVDAEGFEPFEVQDEQVWILGLKGKTMALVLVRNRADRWDHVLRDGREAQPLECVEIPVAGSRAEVFWLHGDSGQLEKDAQNWTLSGFRRGGVLKIQQA